MTQEAPPQFSFEGQHALPVDRQSAWQALNDPQVLQACIRGCDQVERIDPMTFAATFRLKVGPMKKSFVAHLQIAEENSPESYQLTSQLSAGPFGQVTGIADVFLSDAPDGCHLRYVANARAEGWFARLGVSVLDAAVDRYMKQFFMTLVEQLDVEANSVNDE